MSTISKTPFTETKRPMSPALEAILGEELPVLDHGFVRVVDYMGNDAAVVQAARVSYGPGTKTLREDDGLIRYLLRNAHTTPFEMCEIKLHVKLPIFVARQWIRHRTASVNEQSARYSILNKEFYLPSSSDLAAQSYSNRQGRGQPLAASEAQDVLEILETDSLEAYDRYLHLLNEGQQKNSGKSGVARELARTRLPLNFYTQWYWKADLHNLLHFLKLRADVHAQLEIRKYAETILSIVAKWVPITYSAFSDYVLNAHVASAREVEALQSLLRGEKITAESSGLSKSEWSEFASRYLRDA